jgi:L-alanine-DL-glutamate epimerase-like enolase superfamily enzyme
VSIGGAYFREVRSREEIAAELAGYLSRGFTHVKAPAGGLTPGEEEDWVGFLRGCLGNVDLAIDAHWSWRDAVAATKVMDRLDQFSLAWVEDPLQAEAIDAVADLRSRIRTPIAVGDEQSGRWFYQQLYTARAADIWRVDVTTVGGFTEFRRIAALASVAGCPISTHIYPELHVHCAASDPMVMGVEYVDPEADIDLSHRFIDVPAMPRRGMLEVPAESGLGITLNWDLINRQASDMVSLAR